MASVSQAPIASGSSELRQNIYEVNDSLYLLYKPPAETPNIQILFFHGLQREQDYSNAHVSTWRNGDGTCIWPQTWLVEEFPRAHVLSVCYAEVLKRGSNAPFSFLFKRNGNWSNGSVDMYIIVENLLSDVLAQDIGSRCPVVLVGQSIGGLVIKQLCAYAHDKLGRTPEREKARLSAFLNSIKGMFFYSTPHHGSAIASRLKQHLGGHLLTYFETLSTSTARLNSDFDQISKEHYKWLCAGLGETLPTDMAPFKSFVVEEASARGTVGSFYSVPGADHFSICRPTYKISASFQKLAQFIGPVLNDLKVNDSLYLLYKPPADTPNIQILFFHGLQLEQDYPNAHVSTWENGDGSCIWPQTWLVEEFPRAHVLSVCYAEGLKSWSNVSVDMYIIVENLLSDLLAQDIGSRCPVVLVGHSIGGLVIKQLCAHAHDKLGRTPEREKARLSAFLNSIKGMFFYSTPHHGSAIASRLKQHLGGHLLTYFETLSTSTARLNSDFDQISKEHYKWLCAGLGETLPTDMGPFESFVVEEASARGTVGNFYSVPGADHFSICRPRDKISASFRKLATFIGPVLNDLKVNDSLYLLYKPPADTPNIQILFFHGLQLEQDYPNAHVSTWENGDGSCIWPQTWLVEEFPRAHVLSVCYAEGLKSWSNVSVDMYIIVENLLSDLLAQDIGSRCPVVLVGHSIGGLVIKQLCAHAHDKLGRTPEREKARLSAFLNSIKGMFFYSTPHHGSAIASRLKQHLGGHLLTYFETLSTSTARLNSDFDQISKEHYKWLCAGLGETLPTDMGPFESFVVEEASARGTVGNFYSVPGADHFSICRPRDKISASFQKLATFIGPALNDLKGDIERTTARTVDRLPLPFIQDPKYVELKITMIEVKKALESKTPGRVVTLSGASGQGKTSMARHLALYYQNASRRSRDGGQDEELGTQNSASRRFIDGVVFLKCSSNEVISSPLLELWKNLGYQLLPSTEGIPGNASSSNSIQESLIPESRLLNELTRKVLAQKILIILDDVHDYTLIQSFLRIPGESLKFLITTQDPEIWGDRTCEQISIRTPTSEEACNILKNHAYGRHKDTTQPIQEAIDAIVEKAACHPLVLANVAANIQGENDNELEQWENARRNFDELVEDEAAAFLYDERYPRTVEASMKMTLSTLVTEVETKFLLLVASIFESQSTPEVIFKLCAKRRHGRLAKFPRWSKRLQDIDFIKVDFTTFWTTASERTWFLHPLRQKFIEKIEECEVKSVVEGFLERKTNDDDIAVNLLLLIYGQEKWCKQVAEALEIPTPQFQNDSFRSWSFHLAAIKSFVFLIHADPEKEWEKKSHRLAKQILQKYIYCQELDDDSVSILLSTTETYEYTLKALEDFSPLNSPIVLIPKTMTVLVNLLQPENSRPLGIPGALLILPLLLSRFPENRPDFPSIPYSMERLMAFLDDNVNEHAQAAQAHVAGILSTLALDAENRIKIGKFPNAMERLVALLADNVSKDAQKAAARALACLAIYAENRRKIGQLPNAMERLVALLADNVSKDVQKDAAGALGCLAMDAENLRKIGQFPNAMERLVALLADNVSKGAYSRLQLWH